MGRDLRELAFANDPELDWTRRVLVRYIKSVILDGLLYLFVYLPDLMSARSTVLACHLICL